MSDLPSSQRLKPNASQLPVSWYFDPQVLELEQKLLFANSPGYVGHELMVPNPGDYHTLAWMDHGKVLVRNANGIELLSNVCRHRQAILLEGRGNAQNIVCPLHRWTYDMEGKPAKQGAIWFLYYPNVMLEWYPHVLVVSTLLPRSPTHTTNVVEFYYPEDIVLFEREFIEAEQAAYRETAVEDDEIARRMDRGRRALWERGESDAGPYQSPMEDGMMHFHEYLRRGLAGHI